MSTEHLSLEFCRALKDAGYPQDKGDFAWWHGYNTDEWVVVDFPFAANHQDRGWAVIPPIITPDGKGGVFGWLEAQGADIIVNSAYEPRYIMTLDNGARIVATGATPEALIAACLERLAATTTGDAR